MAEFMPDEPRVVPEVVLAESRSTHPPYFSVRVDTPGDGN